MCLLKKGKIMLKNKMLISTVLFGVIFLVLSPSLQYIIDSCQHVIVFLCSQIIHVLIYSLPTLESFTSSIAPFKAVELDYIKFVNGLVFFGYSALCFGCILDLYSRKSKKINP